MTAVILHPDMERVIIQECRNIAKSLSFRGILCTPCYPLWGILEDGGITHTSIKGKISSLTIEPPAFIPCKEGYSLVFGAYLTLLGHSLAALRCPIKGLTTLCPLSHASYPLSHASYPLSSASFRIADAAITSKAHSCQWHVNSSYWCKSG